MLDQYRGEVNIFIGGNKIHSARHRKFEMFRKLLMQSRIFGAPVGPGKLWEAAFMSRRAIQGGMRIQFVHFAHMDRMEGVNIQDGINVLASAGQFSYLAFDRPAQGIGIEQDELAAGQADQRGLRAHIDDSTNPVRAADVPEIVGDMEYFSTHVCLSLSGLAWSGKFTAAVDLH
jgi:hypothetical protein